MTKFEYADVYASQIEKIPEDEHWAILRTNRVNVPGDERSRTAPGHGYPEHTDYSINYEVYLTEEKFLRALSVAFERNESVRAIHVTGDKYRKSVEVTVNKESK